MEEKKVSFTKPPKDWQIGDQILAESLNRIEDNIDYLHENTSLTLPPIKLIKKRQKKDGAWQLAGQILGDFNPNTDRVYLFILKRTSKLLRSGERASYKCWRHIVDKNLKKHTNSSNYNHRPAGIDVEGSKCIYRHLTTEYIVNARDMYFHQVSDFYKVLNTKQFEKRRRTRLIIGYGLVRLVADGSYYPFVYGPISQATVRIIDENKVAVEIK